MKTKCVQYIKIGCTSVVHNCSRVELTALFLHDHFINFSALNAVGTPGLGSHFNLTDIHCGYSMYYFKW